MSGMPPNNRPGHMPGVSGGNAPSNPYQPQPLPSQQPSARRGIYTYQAPWLIYGMNWSVRKDKRFRLAMGSFLEAYSNKVEVVQLNEKSGEFEKKFTFDHPYPTTKIQWIPDKEGIHKDLLATTGDYLRLWEVGELPDGKDGIREKPRLLNNNKNTEYCAPLTSLDWNEVDVSRVGTSSIDTTCTIWDVVTETPIQQLIAHDKEVYDIAFDRQKDVFASVGADGSMRMFDLRQLEHSTIIFESPDSTPLIRLAWNKLDTNYIATVLMNSPNVTILDIRNPTMTLTELKGHTSPVNSVAWAPHSPCHICTAGDDSQAVIWDLSKLPQPIEDPILAYKAADYVNQLQWSVAQPDWVAIAMNTKLQMLKV